MDDAVQELLEKLVEQGKEANDRQTALLNAMEQVVEKSDRLIDLIEELPEVMSEAFARELQELGNG